MLDLQSHIKQLQNSLILLSDAVEDKNHVGDWNYTFEQLQELREMCDFRKLQVEQRAKYLLSLLSEEN